MFEKSVLLFSSALLLNTFHPPADTYIFQLYIFKLIMVLMQGVDILQGWHPNGTLEKLQLHVQPWTEQGENHTSVSK